MSQLQDDTDPRRVGPRQAGHLRRGHSTAAGAAHLTAELVDRGDGWHVSPELLPEGHPQRREG